MVALVRSDNQIHASFSSQSNEWYTPSIYIEAAREVMRSIDLDPASCFEANQTVRAKLYYGKEDNGLGQSWYGNVWLNPPYGTTQGHSNQGIWTRRLISEYEAGNVTQAILLVNAKTDTRWFVNLWQFPICFTHGRINLYNSKRSTTIGNTNGSAFVYLGLNEQKFIDIFSQFGTIAKRVPLPKSAPSTLWEVAP